MYGTHSFVMTFRKRLPINPALNQINPVYIFANSFSCVIFNIIFHLRLSISSSPFSDVRSSKILCVLPNALHTDYFLLWFDHQINYFIQLTEATTVPVRSKPMLPTRTPRMSYWCSSCTATLSCTEQKPCNGSVVRRRNILNVNKTVSKLIITCNKSHANSSGRAV